MAADEAADAFAVGAFDGDNLIAVGLVAPDGGPGSWRVRGMATAPHARARGTGTAVLDALLRHATEHGAHRIWCNARTPARSLYERAGLHVTSEEFEIPDIGPHYVMEMTVRDRPAAEPATPEAAPQAWSAGRPKPGLQAQPGPARPQAARGQGRPRAPAPRPG
jgi:GNAT superfamily N-acetyltransferase